MSINKLIMPVFSLLILMLPLSCNSEGINYKAKPNNWSEILEKSKDKIINGSGYEPGDTWAELRNMSYRYENNYKESQEWVDFQVYLIKNCMNDPKKHEIVVYAMQELSHFPENAIDHYKWLKDCQKNRIIKDKAPNLRLNELLTEIETNYIKDGKIPTSKDIWKPPPRLIMINFESQLKPDTDSVDNKKLPKKETEEVNDK